MASNDLMKRSFIDAVGALYHIALNQKRNAVFIWSVDVCFIFDEQITSYLCDPFMEQLLCVIALLLEVFYAISVSKALSMTS